MSYFFTSMVQAKNIRLIALDIDGVLLTDTFSPVIHRFVTKVGGVYDAELERNVFSRPREVAAKYLKQRYDLAGSPAEIVTAYFREREGFLRENPISPLDGCREFLERLHSWDVRIFCYGGLSERHFQQELGSLSHRFEAYFCTNDIRPGVNEIIAASGLDANKVLFIDDVNLVALACKAVSARFVGMPSTKFQRADMQEAGVRFVISSLNELTMDFLSSVDMALSCF